MDEESRSAPGSGAHTRLTPYRRPRIGRHDVAVAGILIARSEDEATDMLIGQLSSSNTVVVRKKDAEADPTIPYRFQNYKFLVQGASPAWHRYVALFPASRPPWDQLADMQSKIGPHLDIFLWQKPWVERHLVASFGMAGVVLGAASAMIVGLDKVETAIRSEYARHMEPSPVAATKQDDPGRTNAAPAIPGPTAATLPARTSVPIPSSTPAPPPANAATPLEQDLQNYLLARLAERMRRSGWNSVQLVMMQPIHASASHGVGECSIDGGFDAVSNGTVAHVLPSREFEKQTTVDGDTNDALIRNACRKAVDRMIDFLGHF